MRIIFPFEMRAMNWPSKPDGLLREWRVAAYSPSKTWDRAIKTDLLSAGYRMENYLNSRHPLTVRDL